MSSTIAFKSTRPAAVVKTSALDRLNAWFTGPSRRRAGRVAGGISHRQIPSTMAGNMVD